MILNTNLNDTALLHALQPTDAEDIFRAIDSQRDYLGKWLPFVEFTRSVEDSVQFVTEALELPEDKKEHLFAIRVNDSFADHDQILGLSINFA